MNTASADKTPDVPLIHIHNCVMCGAMTPGPPLYLLSMGREATCRYNLCERCLDQFTSASKLTRDTFRERLLDKLLAVMDRVLEDTSPDRALN